MKERAKNVLSSSSWCISLLNLQIIQVFYVLFRVKRINSYLIPFFRPLCIKFILKHIHVDPFKICPSVIKMVSNTVLVHKFSSWHINTCKVDAVCWKWHLLWKRKGVSWADDRSKPRRKCHLARFHFILLSNAMNPPQPDMLCAWVRARDEKETAGFCFCLVMGWLTVWMNSSDPPFSLSLSLTYTHTPRTHIQTQTNMWPLVTGVFGVFWMAMNVLNPTCKITYLN